MGDLALTKSSVVSGVWTGVLTGVSGADAPTITVSLNDGVIAEITTEKTDGDAGWTVRFEVPGKALSEGVQCFLFSEFGKNDVLTSFTVLSGDIASDDVRAELALLRAELDMVKRAFRKHCIEAR